MKLALNIGLSVLVLLLGFFLWRSIFTPYFFIQEKKDRYADVIDVLEQIKSLQEATKDIHGRYTASFDTLSDVYRNGKLQVIKRIGAESDTTKLLSRSQAIELFGINPNLEADEITARIRVVVDSFAKAAKYGASVPAYVVVDTAYTPVNKIVKLNMNPDSLRYIPHGPKGTQFEMAQKIELIGPGQIPVPMFEVIAYNKDILHDYSVRYYKRFEGLRLGSLEELTTAIGELKIIED